MNRFKAAGIHLMLSFLIIITVLVAMYFLWYPGEYFSLMGGKVLIKLIGFIDVFLGPLLTFAIFKAGKKSLKFDLFCIGILQIAALSYGIYVMFSARPIFTVFNKNAFQIAAVVDIAPEELLKAKQPQWRQASVSGPQLVAIGEPNKKDKKETIFAHQVTSSAYRYPKLYDDYYKYRADVIKAGEPLATLAADSNENKVVIDNFLDQVNRPVTDFLVLPISSELAEMSAIVDAKTGDFIKIIDAKQKTLPRKK